MIGIVMKKKIILGMFVGLLISHWGIYLTGEYIVKRKVWKYFVSETEKVNAELMLSYYIIHRNTAVDIKAGRNDRAKCSIDLRVSSFFDEVKTCLKNAECQKVVLADVRKEAPEMLSDATLPFDYIKLKGGLRYCGDTPPLPLIK